MADHHLVLFIYNFLNVHYLLDCVRVLCSAGDLSRFVVIYGYCQRLMSGAMCVDRITDVVDTKTEKHQLDRSCIPRLLTF